MRPGELVDSLRAWQFGHAQAALSSLGVLCRAPFATVLTTAVIGVALALPAGALVALGSLLDVSAHFGGSKDISVFLRSDLDDHRGGELAGQVAALEGVDGVRVISKSQALEEFRAAAQVGYAIEGLGDSNPLPVVLVVTPQESTGDLQARLFERLRALSGVEFVQDDRDWLNRLEALASVLRRGLLLVAGALSLGIILVVGNTVRLSVEAHRAEVEIAKLFGASDAFVRRPFLYHGLYYGLGGAILACVLLVMAGLVMEPAVERLTATYEGRLTIRGASAWHFLGLVTAGSSLGLAGAWLWVGSHLRRVEPR